MWWEGWRCVRGVEVCGSGGAVWEECGGRGGGVGMSEVCGSVGGVLE